jgi:uncharacterized protein YjeT (DUF2065 family)
MLNLFLMALALVLVIEGFLPLINPAAWRRVFEQALSFSDGQLRFIGLTSIAVGLIGLWLLQ